MVGFGDIAWGSSSCDLRPLIFDAQARIQSMSAFWLQHAPRALHPQPRLRELCLTLLAVVGVILCGTTFVSEVVAEEATTRPVDEASLAPSELKASSDEDVIAFINARLRTAWQEDQVQPAPMASDSEWVRRVYLDVLGRIPTIEEAQRFTADKDSDKRTALVNELLGDDYVEEYGNHWATVWTNLLIGRSGGEDRQSLVDREGMQHYLRQSFYRDKPYDKLVLELITATGSHKPGEEDYNGAVNFLLDYLQEKAVTATARTTQIFLGRRLQCAQCHNHPFNNWKQHQFWEMNAFFRQAQPLRSYDGRDLVNVRLDDGDFAGEGGDPREADIYYELRNGLLKVAYPRFINAEAISPSGYVDEVNRRRELGQLVVESPFLSEAVVNRVWGHFFLYGFTKPVDDMGPHNPPSHPDLLKRLSLEFTAGGHDLKRLVRWITLSEAYSLSSQISEANQADDPEAGKSPMFTHFYMRQMTAEQLYESLLIATEAHQTAGDAATRQRMRDQWLQQFVVAFGTDEGDETTTFNGTIPQVLMMMNGDLVKNATSTKKGSFLYQVATSDKKDREKIDYLYRAALGRPVTRPEAAIAQKLWVARGGDTGAALQDVWWALLNSNEFILIH
jgi:hypothetical protein